MIADSLVGTVGIHAGTFAVAVLSSLVPLVSIEVFLIGVSVAIGPGEAAPLVLLAAIGQVLGKLPVYFAARSVAELPGRHRARVERVRVWLTRWRTSPAVVLASSALFGVPPFSILSTAAGVLAIPLRTFCAVVVVGRALRFAALIAATGLCVR